MRKKIVFFTESMELMGGMERVITFLVNELVEEYDVRVLTMYGEDCLYFDLHCPIDTLGITVPAKGILNKIKRYVSTVTRLNAYLKNNPNIEYLVGNSAAMSGSSMIVKLLTNNKIKVIPFEHNKFVFPGKFWQIIRKYTYSKCHRVIALTGDAHQDYLKINAPSVYIPNAIAITVDQKAELKNKKLVAVGRLVPQKGFDNLLHAWKDVVTAHSDWQLEIVGDGDDREMLKTLAEELQVTDSVIFFGQSNHIQERYLEASGFILSSRHEGFGLVIMEAMAHGLPCISFDCASGPSEMVSDGVNGYLVEDQNISELADKIKKYILLSDHDRQEMSRNAEKTSHQYHPDIIIDRWKKEVLND